MNQLLVNQLQKEHRRHMDAAYIIRRTIKLAGTSGRTSTVNPARGRAAKKAWRARKAKNKGK